MFGSSQPSPEAHPTLAHTPSKGDSWQHGLTQSKTVRPHRDFPSNNANPIRTVRTLDLDLYTFARLARSFRGSARRSRCRGSRAQECRPRARCCCIDWQSLWHRWSGWMGKRSTSRARSICCVRAAQTLHDQRFSPSKAPPPLDTCFHSSQTGRQVLVVVINTALPLNGHSMCYESNRLPITPH